MEVDYAAIGQRIRNKRKEKNMTQDDLRNLADISKTHMSHIETGATKLSLPTLIALANALEVTTDSLLCDSVPGSAHIFLGEIEGVLADCTSYELRSMVNAMTMVKRILRGAPKAEREF